MSDAEVSDDEYAAPLGRLLLAVADAEGAAGELVVLRTHSWGPASHAWSRSGEQLFNVCANAMTARTLCGCATILKP